LKLLLNWLNANKIAINVTKTEVILFRHPKKTINYDLKLKLNGKKLFFSSSVKYLGINIDQFLSWSNHLVLLASNLRKANGIISFIRHYLPKHVMLSVYYAMFQSHLQYALQVWGQNLRSNSRIHKLQKTAVRLLTFSNHDAHSKPIFEILNVLSISDQIFLLNIILIYQTLNLQTPLEIQNVMNLSYLPTTHLTRGSSNKLLTKHSTRTSKYGIQSTRYQSILNWNILQSCFNNIDLTSISKYKLENLVKKFLSNP